MNLKELLQRKAALNQEAAGLRATIEPGLAALDASAKEIDREINELLSPGLSEIRKLQEKEFGAVHVTRDGYRVTETIPKRVKWDQAKLREVHDTIRAAGDDPFAWMKAEFKVGEKEYKDYPADIQAVFAPARTVTPGAPVVEFKPLEEEAASA